MIDEEKQAELSAKRATALRDAHLARVAAKDESKVLFQLERKLRDEFEKLMKERNQTHPNSIPWWCKHSAAQGLFRAAEMVCEARKR